MGSGTQDCYMQALSTRTPSYFTNKSLQAYWHATAAGKSSLSSISSPQLLVFSVAPECHLDHWNSTLDIHIPALSFSLAYLQPLRPTPILLLASCTFHSFATSLSWFTAPADLITGSFFQSSLLHSSVFGWILCCPQFLAPQVQQPLHCMLSLSLCSSPPTPLSSHCLILSFWDP